MRPLRACLDCGTNVRTPQKGRCPRCYAKARAIYAGTYQAQRSRFLQSAIANNQPCALCGQPLIRSKTATNGATYDHEHNQLECRSCNSSHRRDTR